MIPPKAAIKPEILVKHQHQRTDNYYWLRDKENTEVIDYLKAENSYREWAMRDTEDLQEEIFQEIKSRIKQTDMSVPYKDNGYFYYSRYEEGKQYPYYCRKKEALKAEEEILLDLNDLSSGHTYFDIGGMSVSPDNRILAYGEDTDGRRVYTIHFKNLQTHENLPETIEGTSGSIAWTADSRKLFYTLKNPVTLRTYKIFRYELFKNGKLNEEVYEELDETFGCSVYKTKSKQYIMIACFANLSDEFHFLRADQPEGEFRMLQKRKRGHEYSVSHFEDHFYLLTNHQARNFRLMKTPVEKPGMENWVEMVPHREEIYLSSCDIFRDYYVLSERKNGLTAIRILPRNQDEGHYLHLEEEAYDAWVSINPEFETNLLRFSYTSMTTPLSTFDYNMQSREMVLLKQQEVPGGYEPEKYQTKRIYARAEDGTKIPVSLVYKKEMKRAIGQSIASLWVWKLWYYHGSFL